MWRTYLWKEFREQRVSLLILTGLVITSSILLWCCVSPNQCGIKTPLIPTISTLTLIVFLLAFNLLGREKQGNGIAFLDRLPGGLGITWRAKTLLLFLAIVGLGLLTAAITIPALYGGNTNLTGIEYFKAAGILISLGLTLAFWGQAISGWLPRSSLALPTTLLLVGAWWIPFIIKWLPTYFYQFEYHPNFWLVPCGYPGEWELVVLFGLALPLTALAAVAISIRGLRRGGNSARSAMFGFPLLLLTIGAGWIWAETNQKAWNQPRFASREFIMDRASVDKNGNFAFINTIYRSKCDSFILNLKNGTFQHDDKWFYWLLKNPDGDFRRVMMDHNSINQLQQHQVNQPDLFVQMNGHDKPRYQLWHGSTGKRIHDLAATDTPGLTWQKIDAMPNNASSYLHPRKATWSEFRSTRNELTSIQKAYPYRLGKDKWLVKKDDHWLLYNDQTRKFRPSPCSDKITLFSQYGSTSIKPTYRKNSGIPVRERIKEILIESHHWLITKFGSTQTWHPHENRYGQQLQSNIRIPSGKYMTRDWYFGRDLKRDKHILVNRHDLSCIEIPNLSFNKHALNFGFGSAIQSPTGSLVI